MARSSTSAVSTTTVPTRPRRRTRKRKRRGGRRARRFAARCTWAVLLMQGAVLLTFAVTPSWWLPEAGGFWAMVWAYFHQPQFYPLVVLLIGGPMLTVVAWHTNGPHRTWLFVAWCVFLIVLFWHWQDRVVVMVDVLQRLWME